MSTPACWATTPSAAGSPTFIAADGVQVGPEHRERALAGALQAASELRAA
jgi:hypothetical protein